MLKIKDGYKLELQIPESMKLFASTKKLIDKTKNRENIPSIEVVEIVLVQCTEADNQYQQKSEVLYTFILNRSYAYLLHAEPSNLLFLKTFNWGFDDMTITFTNQNGRPSEIEDNVHLTMLFNK